MNDEAVYRTAPATPGLLIIFKIARLVQNLWKCRWMDFPSGRVSTGSATISK